MNWITDRSGTAVISVYVSPRSSRTMVDGLHDNALRIRLKESPTDGRANSALIKLLAKLLRVPRSDISMVSGRTGRRKTIAVAGMPAEQASDLLLKKEK